MARGEGIKVWRDREIKKGGTNGIRAVKQCGENLVGWGNGWDRLERG